MPSISKTLDGGVFIEVAPSGGKTDWLNDCFKGKARIEAVGDYLDTQLADMRITRARITSAQR